MTSVITYSRGLLSKYSHHSCWAVAHSPSLTMPTARHFWKRQNWHRFRLLLSTGQSLLARQTYLEFFCTVRCEIKVSVTRSPPEELAHVEEHIMLAAQTSQILLPWKTLCIPHRYEPRSADRRRCPHTQHSSPHSHLGFLTWAINLHPSGWCLQGSVLAPSPWRESLVPIGGYVTKWKDPALAGAVDPKDSRQTLTQKWRKRVHLALRSPLQPSILDWVSMARRLNPSWMHVGFGTQGLKEMRPI